MSDFRTWLLEPVMTELAVIKKQLTQQGVRELAAEDDLKAAVTQLQDDVAANGAAVQKAIALIQSLQQAGSIPAADAEAIVAQLQGAHDSLSATTQSVVTAAP